MIDSRIEELFYFIQERWAIQQRRIAGQPFPWTKDEILQKYRFCCVLREDDAVTKWIRNNWREPHKDDPDIWFAMAVARYVNWPATLEQLGYPVPWNPVHFLQQYETILQTENHFFGNAYYLPSFVLKSGRIRMGQSMVEGILTPLWRMRWEGREIFKKATKLEQAHHWLRNQFGFADFFAGQVIADVKFTPLLLNATDWHDFAVPGPGSMKGLNWIYNRPMKMHWRPLEWRGYFDMLRPQIDDLVKQASIPQLSAQDLQGCLCELSKYISIKEGGRGKRKFTWDAEKMVSV